MRSRGWQWVQLAAVSVCCFVLVVLGTPNVAQAERFFGEATLSTPAAVAVVTVVTWAIAVATTAGLFGLWVSGSLRRDGRYATIARALLATAAVVFALGVQRHVSVRDALCCAGTQQEVRAVIEHVP